MALGETGSAQWRYSPSAGRIRSEDIEAPVLPLEAAPLSLRAASRSYRLRHLEHRDPGDRLLIATAIELDCPLVL
jgi:PIN domain nuclease of toxin-antitoxin system